MVRVCKEEGAGAMVRVERSVEAYGASEGEKRPGGQRAHVIGSTTASMSS